MPKAFTTLCGISAVGALLLLTPIRPAHAARRVGVEKSLLGIRVLESYRAVLARYGQPTRIYRLDEVVQWEPAVNNEGIPTGGVLALDDSASPGGRAGFGGPGLAGMGGMSQMGRGGPPMMGGGPMGVMGGPPPGSMYAQGGRGMGGAPMMGGPMGGKGEGMGVGMPGMMPGMGMPGMAGVGRGLGTNTIARGSGETFANSGGFLWVYFYPKLQEMNWFAFNKDGRVIAILEYGRDHGKPTSRGINLGNSVKQVYSTYGWPDTVAQEGDALALHYNIKQHVQCNIINNKVTMIAVFLTEDQSLTGNSSASGAGRGMGPGMAGGRGMMPGMPGMPGMLPGMSGGPGMGQPPLRRPSISGGGGPVGGSGGGGAGSAD